LTSIFLYLGARSKSGARNVMRAIHDSVRLIAEHPPA
jgi:plasmid stabilization system protein ParE